MRFFCTSCLPALFCKGFIRELFHIYFFRALFCSGDFHGNFRLRFFRAIFCEAFFVRSFAGVDSIRFVAGAFLRANSEGFFPCSVPQTLLRALFCNAFCFFHAVLYDCFSREYFHKIFLVCSFRRAFTAPFFAGTSYLRSFVKVFCALFHRCSFRAFCHGAPFPCTFRRRRFHGLLHGGFFHKLSRSVFWRAPFRRSFFLCTLSHGQFPWTPSRCFFPSLLSQRSISWAYPQEPFPCTHSQDLFSTSSSFAGHLLH